MKNILIILAVWIPMIVQGQLTCKLKGTVHTYISNDMEKNAEVTLVSISRSPYNSYEATLFCKEKEVRIDLKKLDNIKFHPNDINEFWLTQIIYNDVYKNRSKNGIQYDLRKELEDEAIEYVNYLESRNLLFKDSYLESYLYALAYRIYPVRIQDGRPGILNIKILKTPVPNAFIFSNGTMFFTTGLLSTINSEEELIAVMAHEISHFVLDHAITNINLAVQRQKRAEFWAAFATGIAAAADIYLAVNNEYYVPGAITLSTAVLSYSIASQVTERMGLKYSQEQEFEADECATELMKFIEIDVTSLSSALTKMKQYLMLNGNYLALTGEGTHPSIDVRVLRIGAVTSEFNSTEYDKKISFVNSLNAISEFNNHHFEACTNLVNRNISTGVATEDDYVLLSMVTTYLHNSEIKNNEALKLVEKAKTLNVTPNINIPKQEALVLIRLRRLEEAKRSLIKYKDELNKSLSGLESIKNETQWSYSFNYLSNELNWALKMIHKVDKL